MKIATTPTNGGILDKKDPYPYGWREVMRTLPDGTEVLDLKLNYSVVDPLARNQSHHSLR